MKTLVISRPVYDYILPLVEFPQDGDNFYINESIKTLNGIGTLTAITLAKYGIDVSYTGVIGEDENGRKIKEILESYNIDTKYIETSYTENTCVNHKIFNKKTNKYTTITEKTIKNNLTKYKYEFIPEVVIMDDGDYEANLAAINNYPNSKLIYVGEKFTKDFLVYCNKCSHIITSLQFASDATGVSANLNKPKNIVLLFQKFIDLYNANLIIKLNNFDILYCVNDEVRLIKNINKNITNKDNLYIAIFIYYLINTNDIENSIKLTNKVMLDTTNELDMLKNIPEFKDIKEILDNMNSNQVEVNITNNNTEVINNEEQINSTTKTLDQNSTNIQSNINQIQTEQTVSNNDIKTNFNEINNITTSSTNNNIEQIEKPKLDIQEGDNNIEKL